MPSINHAQFRSFDQSRNFEPRSYGVAMPARTGSLFSGLDKMAYGLAAFMGLAPLAMAAWGALVVGA